MKKISVVTGCYNEEENVYELYRQVKEIFGALGGYTYEHIFIDNASTDKTVEVLKSIAAKDKNLKIIVNARNFGHIRSPYYGLLQAKGDAVINIASDLQDPPGLINDFIRQWEAGHEVVVGVKTGSKENSLMFTVRKLFYKLLNSLSEEKQIENYSGFGLFDKKVVEALRGIKDPYPYLRGLILEISSDVALVEYVQPNRAAGITKNNFYTLFDMAMLGIVNNSKVPLRMAIFFGMIFSFIFFIIGVIYLIYKLIFWNNFQLGVAPLVVGVFFFFSVQLVFIGVLGEYIGAIYTQVRKRPLVIERERINFD
ncbi:MAG: glycosyltransferase family 2 protein [Candidatus Omnitrophota bacterium]|jgi:glycosyltransferase involved in cell wall biosynthesis